MGCYGRIDRTVTPDDDRELRLLADLGQGSHGQSWQRNEASGLGVEQDAMTADSEKIRELFQGPADVRARLAPNHRDRRERLSPGPHGRD